MPGNHNPEVHSSITKEEQDLKWFNLILTFLLVGVCFGAGQEPASTSQGKEATYHGKTLGEWVALAKGKDSRLEIEAVEALGRIGPEAIPPLTELLRDKEVWVRLKAAIALGMIGPEAKAAVPALTELLKDKYSQVRLVAAMTLGDIGPEAKAAVPALTELLKDEDSEVLASAASFLVRIDPEKAKILISVLKDMDRKAGLSVRQAAAKALGKIGPEAKTAIPALTELLKDKEVRLDVAEALGKIGPEAKTAVPALTELLKDEKQQVQDAATEALKKIREEKK